MLTIKQITENTEEVIRGLEKKHFKDAKATIEQVLAFNDKRRSTQNQLDKNLAEVNSLSKSIGQLMKEGKKEDAETAKARVAEIKETSKALQAEMDKAQEDMTNLLYTIPNGEAHSWGVRFPYRPFFPPHCLQRLHLRAHCHKEHWEWCKAGWSCLPVLCPFLLVKLCWFL